MHTQYAAMRATLPALEIAAVSGGNLTGSGTIELTYQGRNRAGWNLPTALASISYTAGQRIAITIPSTARAAGEDIHEWVISIAVTPATPNSIRQAAIVHAYDSDQITPRALPATIYLSEDAHLVVGAGQQMAALASLPIGDELINGMVREVANIGDGTGRILEYREESTATADSNTVFPAATGRWHAISGFSTYITDTLAAGGCDRALSALDPEKVLQPPPYPVDGSTGTFVRYWFFGARASGAPATAQGTRVGLRVFDGGLDRSASFDGLLQYIFQGYVDPADGTRDTSGMTTGAQQTYLYGKAGAHLLEKDLPSGQAAEIAVAPRFTLAEQPSLTQGAVLSVGLRAYTQAGSINPLPGFFGNAIAPEGDRLRVVPDGSGVKVLGGAAAVGTLQFPLIGEQSVVGLAEDMAGQYIHINGNGIAYVDDGSPGQQEAIRAKVSTAAGRSAAGVASSYVAVGAGDTLTVTVTHGRSVRANYPEPSGATSVIAGNSDGTFTPLQMVVYLERQSDGELWEYLFAVTDTATQDVVIASLAGASAMPVSIPVAPVANFSLFAPGAASFTSPSGSSDLTADSYRVSFAYLYDGGQVTVIQHESESPTADWLSEIDKTLAELSSMEGGGDGGTAGAIPASAIAPTGAPPTLNPLVDGEANIILQTGTPPKLWIGVSATEWASVDLTVFSSVSYDPNADAYISSLTGTYSEPELTAINQLFIDLKADTLVAGGSMFAALTALWIRGMGDLADSARDLKLTYPLTDSSTPTLTAKRGIVHAGGPASTGIVWSAVTASLDGMIGVYIRDPWTTGALLADADSFGDPVNQVEAENTEFAYGGISWAAAKMTFNGLIPEPGGAVSVSRAGPSNSRLVKNQQIGVLAFAGEGVDLLSDFELFLAPVTATQSKQFFGGWVCCGKQWTNAEMQRLHGYIETLADAFGAGVFS